MSRVLSRPGLVGRAGQLAVLRDAFEDAAREAQVVVIEGEGGIGKTALLEEFAALRSDEDVAWFAGGAVDIGGEPIPYAPVTELLRDIRRRHDAVAGLDDLTAFIHSPVRDRAELFERLLRALEMIRAEVSRVVLVVEDLHWADDATLELIAFLARNLGPGFVLILTCRPDESAGRVRSVLAAVARGRGRRITLNRLDRDDVRTLIAAVRGAPADGDQVEAIYLRGEGNPFLTAELLAADGDRIPASVRDVLLARTLAFDEHGWAAAMLAAVIGVRVPHDLLATAGTSIDGLDNAIKQLVASGMLVADVDGYSFRHALTREVLLDKLLPGDRRRLHAQVADALSTRPEATSDVGVATELATHWYLSRDRDRAASAAIVAGRLCMAVFAFAEAWRQYGRALEGRDGAEDPELTVAAAEAARWSGDVTSAIDLTQRALEASADPATRARLHERLGQYLWDVGRTEDARVCFEHASRELVGVPESELAAEVAASRAHLHLMADDAAAAQRLASDAVELARRVDAPHAEGRARITYGLCRCFLGDLTEGVDQVRRGQTLVAAWGNLEERRRADSNLSYVLLMAGRTAAACETSLASLALLRRHGLDAASGAALTSNTIVLLRLSGRWDEADRLGQEALASAIPSGQARYVHLARAELAIARGDLELARTQLDLARELSAAQAQQALTADLALAETELALARDELDIARDSVLRLAGQISESSPSRLVLQVCELGLRVQAELAARRRSPTAAIDNSAIQTYLRLLDITSPHTTPENDALRASAMAELSRAQLTDDPHLWQNAAQHWERLEHPRETAYCKLQLAHALLAQPGQTRSAGEALRNCHRTSVELGARPLAEAAEALARRARIRLDDPDTPTTKIATAPRTPDFGLTPRERDVLRALTNGDTNREIAAQLYLSPRTVGVHVSNVLAKLGVSTRGQAAALATRLGLVTEPGNPAHSTRRS